MDILITLGYGFIIALILAILNTIFEETLGVKLGTIISHRFRRAFSDYIKKWREVHIEYVFRIRIPETPTSMTMDSIKYSLSTLKEGTARGWPKVGESLLDRNAKLFQTEVNFKDLSLRLSIKLSRSYEEKVEATSPLTDSLIATLSARFQFGKLNGSLMNLSTAALLLREHLEKTLTISGTSAALVRISPIKGRLVMDEWIRKENLDAHISLKSEGKTIIKLGTNQANVYLSKLTVDQITAEYVREILINYYLWVRN